MHLVQILLPLTDNEGHPFPREEFDRLKHELAERFNGVTAFLQSPAEGVWNGSGDAAHDSIVIYEVMVGRMDLDDWRARRAELEKRFRQDEVVVRYMPIERV